MAHSQYSSAPQYAALVNKYDDLLTTVQANGVAVLVNLAHALKARGLIDDGVAARVIDAAAGERVVKNFPGVVNLLIDPLWAKIGPSQESFYALVDALESADLPPEFPEMLKQECGVCVCVCVCVYQFH